MMRSTKLAALVAVLGFAVTGCNPHRVVTLDDLLDAKNMEEFNRYAAQAKSQDLEGIPLLLAVIDDSLETKYDVFSYGKLNTSIQHLHDMAADDVYTVDSVPTLIRVIEEQTAIADTLVTAEILEMITGVDVGYDADFVLSYGVEDEERREEMILQWRKWYAAALSTSD